MTTTKELNMFVEENYKNKKIIQKNSKIVWTIQDQTYYMGGVYKFLLGRIYAGKIQNTSIFMNQSELEKDFQFVI